MSPITTNANRTPQQRLETIKRAMKMPQSERLKVLQRAGIIDSQGNLTARYKPAPRQKKS